VWRTITSSWIMLSMLYMLYIAGSASSSLAPHAYSDGAGPSIDAHAPVHAVGSGMLAGFVSSVCLWRRSPSTFGHLRSS